LGFGRNSLLNLLQTPNHSQSLSNLSYYKTPNSNPNLHQSENGSKEVFGEGSKKRQKSRAQEDELAAMDNAFCSSKDSVRFYDEISPRAIVFGKIVDFTFFAHHHIHFRELFQAQGWENFLSLRKTQYTTLVKHFYTHFHYKEGKITSYVKGKTISLSLNNLANILGVPCTNLQCYTTNDWMQFQGYDSLESIRQMCGNPNIQHVQKPTNT
jgi:hypothetical protein